MANCYVILTAARGCLVTWCFCPGLAGFTLWCELPQCDERFKVSVQKEIYISGGEMTLWLFTAVEDLAEAADCVSSMLPWQKQSHVPRVLMPKNVVQKVAVQWDACREMQLVPAAPTILPLSSKGSKLTLTEDKILLSWHTQKKGDRWAAWDHQGVCAPPFVLKHKYFQLGLGFCSITDLRRVSSGLAHAVNKSSLNLKPRHGRLKLGADG